MSNSIADLELLKQNIGTFSEFCDSIIIIDPEKKKIIKFDDNKLEESDSYCYDSWEHNGICHNCISMRALREHNTYFKLEYSNNRIYLLVAVPVDKEKVVLELMKDVTGSIIVEEIGEKNKNELIALLGSINQLQIRDGMTGLFNRRFINERLPADIISCISRKTPLSIIMLDIDHFKYVNDNHGHVGGDFVLKELSKLLEGMLPDETGWVARYGGEEFLIGITNYDKETAEQLAEKIRVAIESEQIHYNGKIISITASFGVSTLEGNTNITAEEFVDSADKNLYKAKENGRNRVVSG